MNPADPAAARTLFGSVGFASVPSDGDDDPSSLVQAPSMATPATPSDPTKNRRRSMCSTTHPPRRAPEADPRRNEHERYRCVPPEPGRAVMR